jgi:S-adenosylmethionine:tRNA-ribosyltransferase-isomerase (queuine synthetase)
MKLSDFDFDLPEALIATRPARPRRAARLLVAEGDAITDAGVADLGRCLRPGDRLVLNDTRVIPARLSGAGAAALQSQGRRFRCGAGRGGGDAAAALYRRAPSGG